MELKINIGDPKSGRTVQKVVSGDQAQAFLKKRIGEKISGDAIGYPGYEFEITGGSDYCGFPMRRDVRGTARKKILIVKGVGVRKNVKGRKIRKTVAGNTIYSKTAQINLKILKQGEKPIAEEKKGEATGEKIEEKKETAAGAKEKEAPQKKEEKAAEKPAKEKKEAT
jgi:small subunit ribosomal protein S6e